MKKIITHPVTIGILILAVVFLITATHYTDLSYAN